MIVCCILKDLSDARNETLKAYQTEYLVHTGVRSFFMLGTHAFTLAATAVFFVGILVRLDTIVKLLECDRYTRACGVAFARLAIFLSICVARTFCAGQSLD